MKNNEIKILIVDDEKENIQDYTEYLEELYDYKVDSALNAEEAIAKLKKSCYEIVVTDLRMEKNESGFDVLDEINREQLTTFVIILTANGTIEGCRRAFKNQSWDYISKSMEEANPLDEVHNSIQTAMEYLKENKGHLDDKNWVDNNKLDLLKKYTNQYVAVLHRKIIASSKTKNELIDSLLKRKIPPYLAYIESFRLKLSSDKLTIFVEGPTDIKYIEKAINIFKEKSLNEKINFDLVGDKSGQTGNGERNMINAFNFLKENKEFRKDKKILILFDNDIKKLPNNGENYENIHINRMGEYLKDRKGIKGVETFLDEKLYQEGFEKGFIRKTIITYQNEEKLNYKIEQKMAFCEWIIENKANKETFNGFKDIIKRIKEHL